jgi:hypothetical protein
MGGAYAAVAAITGDAAMGNADRLVTRIDPGVVSLVAVGRSARASRCYSGKHTGMPVWLAR